LKKNGIEKEIKTIDDLFNLDKSLFWDIRKDILKLVFG
jgi:hypothetical protein